MLPHDEAGAGPVVVLLHAGVADRRMWSQTLPALAAAGRRVIAVDLPGFGEAPAAGATAPWTAVLDTLDALGVERAALVGNSFGGAVALRAAVAAPERVTGLVLVSAPPVTLDPSPQLAAAWEAEEAALAAGDVEAAVASVVEAWTLPDAPAAVRELVAVMQRRAFELQEGHDDGRQPADPVDEDPAVVGRLAVPALVAVGARDMPDFLDAARDLAAQLPGAGAPVGIPGAGHLAPLETPAAFTGLVLEFLAATA